ncbi:hypothetical protein FB451DRAFT_1214842 [Mycena latifolia]|nr:hypothetical protein FB451DRAFT_1214842 [Mycena latifolia]
MESKHFMSLVWPWIQLCQATAEDAASQGLTTFIIEDGTKAVDPGERWKKCTAEMERKGIMFVGSQDI